MEITCFTNFLNSMGLTTDFPQVENVIRENSCVWHGSKKKSNSYFEEKIEIKPYSLIWIYKGLLSVHCSNISNRELEPTPIRRFLQKNELHIMVENEYIEFIEESTIVVISRQNIEYLNLTQPYFTNVYHTILENVLANTIHYITIMSIKNDYERFKYFNCTQKELFYRLPNKLIAIYLKITPETYCRFKKKILIKKNYAF